jgi:hypothetical protein
MALLALLCEWGGGEKGVDQLRAVMQRMQMEHDARSAILVSAFLDALGRLLKANSLQLHAAVKRGALDPTSAVLQAPIGALRSVFEVVRAICRDQNVVGACVALPCAALR